VENSQGATALAQDELTFLPPEAREVRQALRAGDVDLALESLQGWDTSTSAGLWLHVGRWAGALGEPQRARACLARAAELSPALGGRALLEMARLAADEGAHREEARARAAAWRADADLPLQDGERAHRLAEIGFAFLRARQLSDAQVWLAEAVSAAPERWDARSALVRLAGEDEDRAALERWVASAPEVPGHAAGWWTARGEAARACRDPEAAAQHFERALRADHEVLDAAEHLIRLGVQLGNDAWMDAGLAALRSRCIAQGDHDRGFAAAALEVARGGHEPEAERTYRTLRLALASQLRGGTEGWVGAWLGAAPVPAPGQADSIDLEAAPILELAPAYQAALAATARAFGFEAFEVRSAEHWCVQTGEVPRLGVPDLAGFGVRRCRFWFGRALAGLCLPGLEAAVSTPADDNQPSAAHRFLDRAGLVAALDPAIGLSEVGANTGRGRALTGFVASSTFMDLWRTLGLGLKPPLPKARPEA
jgi:tetratricopeptide (TPR) repeat protein